MAFKPSIAASAVCCVSIWSSAMAQEQVGDIPSRDYVIATASEHGTYYPIGVALALVARINLEAAHGISMEATTSNGTLDNIGLLRDGDAQFAIMQGLIAQWAVAGEETFAEQGPQSRLRAVTMLWPDVSHFLIRSDLAETGTVEDLTALEGLGFSVGTLGSGTELSNRFLLENYGFDFENWSLAFLSFADAITALDEGVIAGANIESGIGVNAVRGALALMGDRLTLLTVTEEQARRFDDGTGRVRPVTIPAGTYPGQPEARPSIGQPNLLAVDTSVPEDDVYLITRTLYENLAYLCELHAAACGMTMETALDGLPIPLHPGAERYFIEMGLILPGDGATPASSTE